MPILRLVDLEIVREGPTISLFDVVVAGKVELTIG